MTVTINGSGTIAGITSGGLGSNPIITTAEMVDANTTPAKLSQPLTLATAQASTSGTSIDFTGIPSWVKRITVMFNGVSTNGTSNLQIQIGSGSVVTTGYNSIVSQLNSSSMSTSGSNTSGFVLTYSTLGSTSLCSGQIVFTNQTGNSWIESGLLSRGDAVIFISAGNATALSGALDRVRITTVNGADTFDAGSINIMYEG